MPCANTQKARHFALKHGLNSPETDYFQIKIKKTLIKFCRKEKLPYLCTRLQQVRALSSAGLEHLPYKQRVGGSKPHNIEMLWSFLFIDKTTRNGQTIRYGLTATMKLFTASNPHRLVCPYIFRLFIMQISLTARLLARCLQTKKPLHDVQWLFRVGAEGFEPPTLCL